VHRLPFVVVLFATVLALVGCGDDHDDHDDDGTTGVAAGSSAAAEPDATALSSATASAIGQPNEADVAFVQRMIPHHEQAIEMSQVALDPGVGAGVAVTGLATRIRDAQDPEIETMRGWLQAWGEEEIADMSEHHDEHGMEGMMSADEMARLGAIEGADFDRAWMEMMIRHHQGAIAMSEKATTDGSLAEVKALADTIISAQQKEIDEMQGLLDG
jgi:uncharacterized protein (DUF305 family)